MKRIALLLVLLLAIFSIGVRAAASLQTYFPIVDRPASTPTLTPTPTPTPTPIPLDVQILPNDSHYVDSIDYLNVVGEVLNNTSYDLSFVEITATFFNASGQPVDQGSAYTYLDDLPAWGYTCFEISLPVPSGWVYYQFEAPTYYTDGHPLPNLTILNDGGSHGPTFEWYDITGDVRNDEGVSVNFVSPVATLYNNLGKVVGCDSTSVDSTNLAPGQTSSFYIFFSGRDYSDVTSYRLQVDGNW